MGRLPCPSWARRRGREICEEGVQESLSWTMDRGIWIDEVPVSSSFLTLSSSTTPPSGSCSLRMSRQSSPTFRPWRRISSLKVSIFEFMDAQLMSAQSFILITLPSFLAGVRGFLEDMTECLQGVLQGKAPGASAGVQSLTLVLTHTCLRGYSHSLSEHLWPSCYFDL